MSIQVTMDALPRILISKAEEKRLTAIATAASQRVPEASAALLSELERAEVLPEMAMPADVVRIARPGTSRRLVGDFSFRGCRLRGAHQLGDYTFFL